MKYDPVSVRRAIIASGVAALAAPVMQAQAAEQGFYVAGFYGEAKIPAAEQAAFDEFANFVYSLYGFTPQSTTSAVGDDTDASFGMMVGYRLLPNLALEGGYVDLGEIGYRNDSFGLDQEPWFQKATATTGGIALSALGILPVSYRWEVYARGGVLLATNELQVYITDFAGYDVLRSSESSTEAFAGVGASFSFAEVYGARIEYQRVFNAGDGPIDGDLDVLSIGFTASFQ